MGLLPNVSGLLDDEELGGGVPFTVIRDTKTRTLEADAAKGVSRQRFEKTGNIQPAQTEDLQLLPEEERSETVIVIRSAFSIQLGRDDGVSYTAPDLILYDNAVWKAVRVDHWDKWGFTFAYCKLQKGQSPNQYAS